MASTSYAGYIGSRSHTEDAQCHMFRCFWKDDMSFVNCSIDHSPRLHAELSRLALAVRASVYNLKCFQIPTEAG
jgi:hypothetical protein